MTVLTPRYRIGHGFDAHRLVVGRPCIIGGVIIPHERGPLGHSDGDALCHAIADALLGAANQGSLGELFPDSNPSYRHADSMDLLGQCMMRVRENGYEVENLDATVVVQSPRLAPYLADMCVGVAKTLQVQPELVSIKAKTSDGMGYTGDGSGIAAYAVVLIRMEQHGN